MIPIILFNGYSSMTEGHTKEDLELVIAELRHALTKIYMQGGGKQAGIAVEALNQTDHIIIDKQKSKIRLDILESLVKITPKQQKYLLNTLRK